MKTYQVQAGDTLAKIATKFYHDASRFPVIAAANKIPKLDRMKVGQQLIIPDLGQRTSCAAPSPRARSPLMLSVPSRLLLNVTRSG